MEHESELVRGVLERVGEFKVPHTYLFFGANQMIAKEMVTAISKQLRVKSEDITTISPFESEGKKEVLSIKQARELKHVFSLTPAGSVRLGVILYADTMTIQTANALLKLLEEPPKYGLLLLFSETDNIIETIKSRSTTFNIFQNQKNTSSELVEHLIGKDFYEQSKVLESIVKQNQTNTFLDQLQKVFHKKLRNYKNQKNVLALKDVENARKKILKNANPRLTLECLILKYSRILNDTTTDSFH